MSDSANERKKHFYELKRWGLWISLLVFLNVFSILWIVGDTFGHQSEAPDETETATEGAVAEVTTAEATTAEETINVIESTASKPTIEYPEGAVIITGDGLKTFYFRNWFLSFFFIPEELGDSCCMSTRVPKLKAKASDNRETSVDLYVQKDGQYYRRRGCSLVWDEGISINPEERRTAWLNNINQFIVWPSLEKMDSMTDAYNPYSEYILEISADLHQEIYPAGKESFEHFYLWDGILEEVGFWWMAQTGELFGEIRGEVYVMSAAPRECWICVEGMMPIKVASESGDACIKEQQLPIIKEADFEEERDKALARLSFDLKVEALSE